jgi:ankyrin repeat protein
MILACGRRWLDLDAVETSMNNTALHLLCHQSENQTMIKLILDAGAHVDCMNRNGLTPFSYTDCQQTKALLKLKSTPASLKCLCARIIADRRLNTNNFGPSTSKLNMFIALHGCLVTN